MNHSNSSDTQNEVAHEAESKKMRSGWIRQSSYVSLPDLFYRQCQPALGGGIESGGGNVPKMVIFNTALADSLGLEAPDPESLAAYLAGAGAYEYPPLAMAYAGHQFGHLTMLGDGRAHLLGEHITPDDARFDVQLKGSGATPYSRGGDGKAALAPLLREYIMSEALAALNIPTTRSLAVVATGENVIRETILAGAVLTRLAASHLRIGTFEFAAAQQDKAALVALADYAIARHDPNLVDKRHPYIALLRGVMRRQILLIVAWLRVGFVHGVMNTDNTTLSGETIDYGPCAFIDEYNANAVFSAIDEKGRYAFVRQADIIKWNLARFAEALLPLFHKHIEHAAQMAQEVIEEFDAYFLDEWLAMMRGKFGLTEAASDDSGNARTSDGVMFGAFLTHLQTHKIDYTNFFRGLNPDNSDLPSDLKEQYQARFRQNKKSPAIALEMMRTANPARIPRNHLVEAALNAATQDNLAPLHDLLAACATPYTSDPNFSKYEKPPNEDERVRYTFCGT